MARLQLMLKPQQSSESSPSVFTSSYYTFP